MRFGKIVLAAFLIGSLLFGSVPQSHAAGGLTIIVELQSGVSVNTIASLLNATVLDAIPGTTTYLLKVSSFPSLSSLLQAIVGIRLIELNLNLKMPEYSTLGVLAIGGTTAADWYRYQPAMQKIHAPDAQRIANGAGIVVADINSITDYSHPALRGRFAPGYDFVVERRPSGVEMNQSDANFLDQSDANFLDQSDANFLDQSDANFLDGTPLEHILSGATVADTHGTLCAGLIAATAPGSQIMPLRVFDENGEADIFTIAKATRWAVTHGAHVINMSFGTYIQNQTFKKAIEFAASRRVTVVSSAGNMNWSQTQYPAAYSSVLATAASNYLDQKASFSNYGSYVFIAAPGDNVISSYPGGRYSMASGTSFAAPIVAGAVAILKSRQPGNVRNALAEGAANIDAQNPAYQGKLGHGRVDILAAIQNQ